MWGSKYTPNVNCKKQVMGAGLYTSFHIPLCLKHFIIKCGNKQTNKHTPFYLEEACFWEKREITVLRTGLSHPPFLCIWRMHELNKGGQEEKVSVQWPPSALLQPAARGIWIAKILLYKPNSTESNCFWYLFETVKKWKWWTT